jgi:two-component system response regulator FixJ
MARTTYLVDDDIGVRKALGSLLELQPDQIVRDFGSGEAFLAEVAKLEPGVLLLDLNMPGLGGLDVLDSLKSSHPGKFIVLILTGMGSVPDALAAKRDELFGFIEKPCDAQSLFDTVDEAHQALARDRASAQPGQAGERVVRPSIAALPGAAARGAQHYPPGRALTGR